VWPFGQVALNVVAFTVGLGVVFMGASCLSESLPP